MNTWRVTLAYHGAGFAGWQRQAEQRTVEGEFRAALARLTDGKLSLRAAGRTDAGVHARGQTVSLQLEREFAKEQLPLALMAYLPSDIAVLRAEPMPAGFDAKSHAIGKRYTYRALARRARDPFRDDVTWHCHKALDVEAMQSAARHLVGEHDYESFRSTHCDAVHARRYLWCVEVVREDDDVVRIEVRGNAFCRSMVRVMAGTLISVGRGRIRPDDVKDIVAAKDRERAGQTAPAKGLTLERVYYPDTASSAGIPAEARFPRWPVTPATWPPTERQE